MSIPQFAKSFSHIKDGERIDNKPVRIAGRLDSKRVQGQNLVFYDIVSQDQKIQIMADRRMAVGDSFAIHDTLRRGDIVGVVGVPGKSKRGELTVFPTEVILLSPCLRLLPPKHSGLKDQEIRYRQRYLDMIMNPAVKSIFHIRSRIINYIRRFLDERVCISLPSLSPSPPPPPPPPRSSADEISEYLQFEPTGF